MIDPQTIQKVRANLRISHNKLDDEVEDTISACLKDLQVCGVQAPVSDDPLILIDPLILNAVKLYCRAAFTDDPVKAKAYQERYDSLKSCLMMASEYSGEAVANE